MKSRPMSECKRPPIGPSKQTWQVVPRSWSHLQVHCGVRNTTIWSAPFDQNHGMNHAQPTTELRRRRVIRLWLLTVATLVLAMVLVGGATRLTESGLSIVEWQPVGGTLPPLTDAQWQTE